MNVDIRPKARSEAFFRKLFGESYFPAQYHFVQLFTEHLADCSREFDADLQTVLILGIVGQKTLDAYIRADFHSEGAAPPEIVPAESLGMNSSSIAEISGIPRETVRRKLQALAERDWVTRDERGCWRITANAEQAHARRDLEALHQRMVQRVSRFLAAVERIAAEP